MDTSIILIGPMGAGKTTIGERLSRHLNLGWIQLDEIRQPYYDEIGYDHETTKQIHAEKGMTGIIEYWKPFEAYSVERVLADYPNSVIDFGAGQSVYEDEVLFARVKKALTPFPNVILLLPSPDIDETIRILKSRVPAEITPDMLDWFNDLNAHFIRHKSNGELAKITVYTNERTPDETCDDIIGKLK